MANSDRQAKASNPLDSLSADSTQEIRTPTMEQFNELRRQVDDIQQQLLAMVTRAPASNSFEDQVWQSIIIGGITSMLHPSRVIHDTDKAMQQQITRILRMADSGLEAARTYKKNLQIIAENQAKDQANDPLKQLLV